MALNIFSFFWILENTLKCFSKIELQEVVKEKEKNSVLFTTYLKKRKRILTYFIREKYHCNVQLTSCFTGLDPVALGTYIEIINRIT